MSVNTQLVEHHCSFDTVLPFLGSWVSQSHRFTNAYLLLTLKAQSHVLNSHSLASLRHSKGKDLSCKMAFKFKLNCSINIVTLGHFLLKQHNVSTSDKTLNIQPWVSTSDYSFPITKVESRITKVHMRYNPSQLFSYLSCR